MIRRATAQDAAALCEIWNPVIIETAATFNSIPKSQSDLKEMIAARPFFVASAGGAITGFAHYGQFRGGVGYAQTAEHTIIIAPEVQGKGTGRALMTAVLDHARFAGFHSMWAGVSADNPEGIGFHEKMGFAHVARLSQVGRKFDRWIDLILMQKML